MLSRGPGTTVNQVKIVVLQTFLLVERSRQHAWIPSKIKHKTLHIDEVWSHLVIFESYLLFWRDFHNRNSWEQRWFDSFELNAWMNWEMWFPTKARSQLSHHCHGKCSISRPDGQETWGYTKDWGIRSAMSQRLGKFLIADPVCHGYLLTTRKGCCKNYPVSSGWHLNPK